MGVEAGVQQRAAAAGAPVPHILTADNSPAALGNPYLICDEIGGETIVRRIYRNLDDARPSAAAAAMRAGARRDPPRGPRRDRRGRGRPTRGMARPTRRDGRHHGDLRVGVSMAGRAPPAAVAAGARARRLPDGQPDRRRLGPGGGAGLGAGAHRRGVRGPGLVLHPGMAIRRARGSRRRRAGSVESFLSDYESAAGTELDRDVFRWWLTVATLRWGVICRFQAERHLSGQTPSVELAAIGRRVAETEWDVLDLLEGGGPR